MPKWAKHIHLAMLMLFCMQLYAMVPPHPLYGEAPVDWQGIRPEQMHNPQIKGGSNSTPQTGFTGKRIGELPANILAVMVEFDDVRFKTEPQYPDYLPHDQEFFERWMLHLSDLFLDASHGRYEMQYTVHPEVFRMPRSMAWYGSDSATRTDARLMDILPDLMQYGSSQINYSDFDGLIIFHAGAGQETDVGRASTESIWSTFLTRRAMQAYFDPDNDDYPGFETPDGAILTNVVIVPEDEYHDYFPGEGEEDADLYLFSLYGVLAHQFGHILGLPTLFDNDSSNGASQGIGNWGLMGTGVWNGSGYVPAQLSAWCRYYLGWEDYVTITQDGQDFEIDHFLNHQEDALRLYKVPISEQEYFLIENRQQNPDGSLDPYTNMPSYSFKLLPEDEQEYYEYAPLRPYFNFMKNRYVGSEWDFFLPGFGMSPETDGSGILIWHIDENVIAEKFSPNFDINRVNGYAPHKGVDLEEADGYQHLDTSLMDDYKYGGPDDSYRAGNNDYFGNSTYQGLTWLPTAESYYGGIPLEIYDISESRNKMSFSVRFAWNLDAGYDDISTLPAAAINLDDEISSEIFYPMPDGRIALFHDEVMAPGFPIKMQAIPHLYAADESHLYIPMQIQNLARLYVMSKDRRQFTLNLNNHLWLSHPVDAGDRLFLPMLENNHDSRILSYDKDSYEYSDLFRYQGELVANLSLSPQSLRAIGKKPGDSFYSLIELDLETQEAELSQLPIPSDSLAIGLYTARLDDTMNLIVQCPQSIYVFDLLTSGPRIRTGFPVVLPDSSSAAITLADTDKNGALNIIRGSSTGISIIDHRGSDISRAALDLGLAEDSASSGILVADLDGDGHFEMAGSFNFNRLAVWEENFRIKRDFPVSFSERGRNMPFVAAGLDSTYYLWIAADKGRIYRVALPVYDHSKPQALWQHEYANLQRTAFHPGSDLQNQYISQDRFVKSELYIFPNPLKSFYEPMLRLSLMPTEDMMVNLKIFDVSGKLVYDYSAMAYAYLRNMDVFQIPVDKLSSGVYFAIVSGKGETHRLRFGIEK